MDNSKSFNYFSPYVTTRSTDERLVQRDIDSVFLDSRIINFEGEFNEENCNNVRKKLMFLAKEDPDSDITIYINSPGGSVPECLSLIDTIRTIKPKVNTVNVASAMSCGLVLACAATGVRYGLPSSMWLLHQVRSGCQGKITDMEIEMNLSKKYESMIYKIISESTGKSVAQIAIDGKDDNFMDFEEAKAYGLVDEVIQLKHSPRHNAS